MSKYATVYEAPEHPGGNWSAYAPDLPGLGVAGDTFEECRANMASGIAAHIAFLGNAASRSPNRRRGSKSLRLWPSVNLIAISDRSTRACSRYRSASTMRAKRTKARNMTSSFSNLENTRRKPLMRRNSRSTSFLLL